MKVSWRKIGAVILALALLGAGAFWYAQKRAATKRAPARFEVLRHAADGDVLLSRVEILAFYFVPSDVDEQPSEVWQEKLAGALAQTASFYEFQFHDAGRIDYKMFNAPVYGNKNTAYYDGKNTGHGNPHALMVVRQELIDRVLTEGGDKYDAFFAKADPGTFRVLAILYEGVGSSATLWVKTPVKTDEDLVPLADNTLPAFLVSRNYLTDESRHDNGVTDFAHEFGHTIGLPDSYDTKTGKPNSDDIMGTGRFRPLNYTYISTEAKKALGLTY